MYHPNIEAASGKVHLHQLLEKEYKQEMTLEDLLKALQTLLEKPNTEDRAAILNQEAWDLLQKNTKQYQANVTEESLKDPTVKLVAEEPTVIIEQQ